MAKHKEWCRSVLSFGSCDCGADVANKVTSTIPIGLRVQHSVSCDWITSNTKLPCSCSTKNEPQDIDGVRKPSHYQVFDGVESIEIIARSMTVSEFRGFCMGNVLKYRLRAGKKSELATLEKDLNKAAFYQELYDLHKGKCYDSE